MAGMITSAVFLASTCSALTLALAALIEAVHPQFYAEFAVEAKPPTGKPGNPGKTWVLIIYPIRGDIEHLPKSRAKGSLPPSA